MTEKSKFEALAQLGLPPMELAEKTAIDQNNNGWKRCMNPILQKVLAIITIILLTIGSYILLMSVLQGFDNDHSATAEIVIVTANQDSPNITVGGENIEIYFQFKNKSSHPIIQRSKRDIQETSKDAVNSENFDHKLNELSIQKTREIIMNKDVDCTKENAEEICKSIVTEINALHKNSINVQNSNTDDNGFDGNKREPKELPNSTEKTKRETNPLSNLEILKPTPNLPFEAKDSYGYVPENASPQVIPYTPHGHSPLHLSDTCLLARLLKQQYPHGVPNFGGYAPLPALHHEPHHFPYPGFGQYSTPYHQGRDADIHKIHPQDIEILTKYLTPQPMDNQNKSTPKDAECMPGTLPCSNGENCITEDQWCNGRVDCSDASDESRCSCKSRVDKARLCDGYFDCPFGEDEMGCNGCSESMFSCDDLDTNSQSTCFSKEQRCNNVADCPNRRDEMDCTMLSPTLHKTALFALSNTQGFLHRNFKGEWYAVCKNPYMWAHDACRRETGLIIRPPFIQVLPIDPMMTVNYLNTGQGGLLHMSNTCFNSSAIYVTCPDLLCGTRIMSTTQILREHAEVENHLFGRNKRFLQRSLPYPIINRRKRETANATAENDRPIKYVNMDWVMRKNNESLRNKRKESRVVGGRPSQPAMWPWMVAMYRNGMFHCGGVVLTQSWVMSAAHCVSKFWEHYFEVRVGMLRRFSFSPQKQNHKVTHIIVNQFYDQEDMKNDLSLLRVKPGIEFSRWVRPICLPGPETAGPEWLWGPPEGTTCTAVGWGATEEHGPDPDHLREVEVPVWGQCKHKEDKSGKEICAGLVEGGKDACQGDSGGPLLCKNPLNPQQWYMAGIVSHGDGCGRKGEPGVYTRVSLFVKWIRYHILSGSLPTVQPKQECPGFRCISGIAKCLPSKRMCDKIVDCLGGEDEINCNTMRTSHPANLFLSSPPKEDETVLNDLLFAKETNTEQNITHSPSSEKHNHTTEMSSNPSTRHFSSREADNADLSSSTTEIDIETSSTSFRETKQTIDQHIDFTKASTMEFSVSGSSENAAFVERSDGTKRSSINDDESMTNRGDLEDTFTVSISKESLESMSSVLVKNNSREADILEDWNEPSTTEKLESTAVKIDEEKTTSTSMSITESKEVHETTTQNIIHFSDMETTTVEGIEKNKVESKDLLIDLPDSNPTSQALEDESHSRPQHDIKQETESNAKIITTVQDAGIIDKIKDIIISKLVPASLKKKPRIPKIFECRHIYQNIPYNQRCDRKADCEDGTDELGCTCTDYLWRFDKHLLCDGIFDCADGQDEAECYSCPEDHFMCKRSQQCLPMNNVCDGKPHCPSGEDELDCYALTDGQNIILDSIGTPKINLQGFLTKKHIKNWHVVCEENLSTEQQELAASHICHYLGFSSANRYLVKHINVRDEDILKSASAEDFRSRRNTEEGLPVHFAYRKVEDDNARHIVIKDPEILKEKCVPNVTKTCMSLYVYCNHALYTSSFDLPNEIFYNRESETHTHMWPWIAKVFVDGEYKCTGVLIDLSWTLVSHSCLWDVLLSHHHVTVVLGSHRTLSATKGMYEQVYQVDFKKDLYHSKAVLLHLNQSAQLTSMVRPMMVETSNIQVEKPTVCLSIGQDDTNSTVGIFLEETNEKCDLHSRCFTRTQKESICSSSMVSRRPWAGIISCHSELGWYPAASFVDSRGECGIGHHIIASEISNLKNEIKHTIGRTVSESTEVTSITDCEGIRCGRGRCIKLTNVCDGVPDCEDQNDELEYACEMKSQVCSKKPHRAGCDCSKGQFKCHNGRCVAKELFRDGNDDCGDGTDEPNHFSCSHYLARVEPSRLCDGILHCKDRSDEDPLFCKCYAKKNFKCNGGHDNVDVCVAPDMLCDGVRDCPNGEDEATCIGLSAPEGSVYGTGQVMIRSHGVWHLKCYQTENHTKSELEAICKELGFISGHAKLLTPPPNHSQPFNNFLLDPFSEIKLNNKTTIELRNTNKPLAKAIVDESKDKCHPVYIECL